MLFALLAACTRQAPDPVPDSACEAEVWFVDVDGDGFGDTSSALSACFPPDGWVSSGADCADDDPEVYPGAAERCNGQDDDCDGAGDPTPSWADADGDGFGDPATSGCEDGPDRVDDATDCDDGDAAVHPGADDACNGVDDNCDGEVDEGHDRDGDGARDALCPEGTDCDDDNAAVGPAAEDACGDGVDQDCDGFDVDCGFTGDLALADAALIVRGEASDDLGRQLKVGDVTGDGIDDFVAATVYRGSLNGGGVVYEGGSLRQGDVSAVAWRFESDLDSRGAGRSVGVGDVDGDGIGDVGFGAPYATDNGMRVVLGPITGDGEVSDGIWINGEFETYAGHGADLGDVDGDGIEDAVVGAFLDREGGNNSGCVWVSYGPIEADVELATDGDLKLIGEAPIAYSGRWVRADGDYNADGVSDLLIGAPYLSESAPQAGGAYVVYGPPVDGTNLADADGRYLGAVAYEYAGTGLGFGDVDMDGDDDPFVGSLATDNQGALYVFLSPEGDYSVGDAAIILTGTLPLQNLGADAVAVDIGDDGVSELLVGAWGDDRNAGGAYLFAGLTAGTYGPDDATALLFGASGEQAGAAVNIGDIDGDGVLEALVAAPFEGTNGYQAGAVYGLSAGG